MRLTFYAVDGTAVSQFVITDEVTIIPTNDLMSGIYHLSIEDGNNRYFQKLVITR